MSQTLILEQFQKYLTITSRKYLKKLEKEKSINKNKAEKTSNAEKKQKYLAKVQFIEQEIPRHKAFIEALKKHLGDGHCHGFVICHGAMASIEKLKWWENVLVTLANWDGSEEALANTVILPGSNHADEDKSLDKLFYRALYYIVYHQADLDQYPDFGLEELEQDNLLKPNEKHFEILIKNEQPAEAIKKLVRVAGHFARKDVLALLNGEQIKGNICKVETEKHTIRIDYDGKVWMVYDPNYDHRQLSTIHKIGTKEEIVDELLEVLEPFEEDLVISIATLKNNQPITFPYFNKMIKNRKIDLIKGQGLHLLAKYRPDLMHQSLKSLAASINNNNTLPTPFSDKILEKDKEKDISLPLLAHPGPSEVTEQQLVEKKRALAFVRAIGVALQEKGSGQCTGFQALLRHAPDALNFLLQIAEGDEGKSLLAAISKALPEKNKNGWSGLQVLVTTAPHLMEYLIGIADKQNEVQIFSAIAASLQAKANRGPTGLHQFARCAPIALARLFRIAKKKEDVQMLSAITAVLAKKNRQGWTSLHVLARYAPIAMDYLFQIAERTANKQVLCSIAKALPEKSEEGWTVLHLLAKFEPELANRLVKMAVKEKNSVLLTAIVNTLPQKNKNDENIFHIKAEWDTLPILIKKLLIDHANVYQNLQILLKVFGATNNNNLSAWQSLSQTNNMKVVLYIITKSLENLTIEQLTDFDKKLQRASFFPGGEYSGLKVKREAPLLFSPQKVENVLPALRNKTKQLLIEKIEVCQRQEALLLAPYGKRRGSLF